MQSEYKEKQEDAKGKFQSDIQKLGLRLQSLMFLSPRRVSPFLAWGDFDERSAIPKEKWGTTRSLTVSTRRKCHKVRLPFRRQIDFQIWAVGPSNQ